MYAYQTNVIVITLVMVQTNITSVNIVVNSIIEENVITISAVTNFLEIIGQSADQVRFFWGQLKGANHESGVLMLVIKLSMPGLIYFPIE